MCFLHAFNAANPPPKKTSMILSISTSKMKMSNIGAGGMALITNGAARVGGFIFKTYFVAFFCLLFSCTFSMDV